MFSCLPAALILSFSAALTNNLESGQLPLLVTGGSQQSPEWIAQQGYGWMTYPRDIAAQEKVVKEWQTRVTAAGRPAQPVMQPLYVDLAEDPSTPPKPIHLGFHSGIRALRNYLESLKDIGINHVALNFAI